MGERTTDSKQCKAGSRVGYVLGTPLQLTTYDEFMACCRDQCQRAASTIAVDFTNTQIVTMRRHESEFRTLTHQFDFFIPDGMPLIWCLNWQGAKLKDRVYGPTFMRRFIQSTPAPYTHYFLGGTPECVAQLESFFRQQNSSLRIVGSHHGYFKPEQETQIVKEINRLSPDFIWIGLGTPKQQRWIHDHKNEIHRGILFAVGFGFDVNAGTKKDAPLWMQRRGLTWVFRLFSEPGRLAVRYLRYNTLFLIYLLWDGLRARAFAPSEA